MYRRFIITWKNDVDFGFTIYDFGFTIQCRLLKGFASPNPIAIGSSPKERTLTSLFLSSLSPDSYRGGEGWGKAQFSLLH